MDVAWTWGPALPAVAGASSELELLRAAIVVAGLLGIEGGRRRAGIGALPGNQLAGHHRLGRELLAHVSVALHAHRRAPPRQHLDLDAQLVAGHHGPAKTRALDAGKDHQLVLAVRHL